MALYRSTEQRRHAVDVKSDIHPTKLQVTLERREARGRDRSHTAGLGGSRFIDPPNSGVTRWM